MKKSNKANEFYKSNELETASPGKVILMMYDGALKFLRKAKTGFDYEDSSAGIELVNNNIIRVQHILAELKGCLDPSAEKSREGEQTFSRTMSDLYDYMDMRLVQANLKKEVAPLEEVETHLTQLRDAWHEMLGKQEASEITTASVSCSA